MKDLAPDAPVERNTKEVLKEEIRRGASRRPYDSEAAAEEEEKRNLIRSAIDTGDERGFEAALVSFGLSRGSDGYWNALRLFRNAVAERRRGRRS